MKDKEHALRRAVEVACRFMGGWRAKIALFTEEHGLADLIAVGFEEALDIGALIRQNGISAQVIASGEPWYAEDVQKIPDVVNPVMLVDGVRAAVCVPFGLRGDNFGVMWIHFREPRRFLPSEIEALQLHAGRAAIAYKTSAAQGESDALRQFSEALSQKIPTQEILLQIQRAVGELSAVSSATVILHKDSGIWRHAIRKSTPINQEEVESHQRDMEQTRSGPVAPTKSEEWAFDVSKAEHPERNIPDEEFLEAYEALAQESRLVLKFDTAETCIGKDSSVWRHIEHIVATLQEDVSVALHRIETPQAPATVRKTKESPPSKSQVQGKERRRVWKNRRDWRQFVPWKKRRS